MFLQFKFLEVFTKYSAFESGLVGAGYFAILFFVMAYAILRGYVDNPKEMSFTMLLPVILVTFILSWFGLTSHIIGFVGVLTLIYAIKHYMGLPTKVFLLLTFQILSILWIFGNAGMFAQPLIYLYIVGNFIRGELLRRDREKNNKKEDESDKK